jgi:hypothetical protein
MHLMAALARIGVYEEEICMKLNRPPDVASNPVPTAGIARLRGHRLGAGVVGLVSVTALVAAGCALASAAAAAPAARTLASAHRSAAPAARPASYATKETAFAAKGKHSSKTSVSVKPKTAYLHARVKLSAAVKSSGKTPTGTVTFRWGSKKLCSGKLSKGKMHCDARFSTTGTHTVKGRYAGNSTHKASSGTAKVKIDRKKAPPPTVYATITKITSPAYISTEPAGTPFTVTATVASTTGDTVPTGTVKFTPNNLGAPPYPADVVCTATLVDGTGSCVVDPPVGTWGFVLFTATYAGDATHTGSVSSGEHKLITPDITKTALAFTSPATEGVETTLTATVTDEPGKALGDAYGGPDLVTFSVGGVAIPDCIGVAVTDPSDGPDNVAICHYTPATTGTLSLQAAYAGDEYATASSSPPENITVNP